MTAEKTLNILEVNPESLAGFLLEKQMEVIKSLAPSKLHTAQTLLTLSFPRKAFYFWGS